MAGKVKGRRPGRPPGSKNKRKPISSLEEYAELVDSIPKRNHQPKPQRKPRVARVSFLQVSPKYQKLIQKWSNETKIGMQQVLDDILLAGANAAHKSFYRGLINSRKATEALFDAETNTEGMATKTGPEPERNGSVDTESDQQDVRSRSNQGGTILQQSDIAPVRPGYLEETGADLGEPVGIIDAPQTTETEQEQTEEADDGDDEPPY